MKTKLLFMLLIILLASCREKDFSTLPELQKNIDRTHGVITGKWIDLESGLEMVLERQDYDFVKGYIVFSNGNEEIIGNISDELIVWCQWKGTESYFDLTLIKRKRLFSTEYDYFLEGTLGRFIKMDIQ